MNMLTKWRPLGRNDEIDTWRSGSRWDPMRDVEDMMRGIQRMFSAIPGRASDESMNPVDWCPSVDIGETPQEFVLKAELPEVHKEDIQVHVENGTLTISGERRAEKDDSGVRFHRVERSYGRFERSFNLPNQTQPDQITSEYRDGILTIHLPKNSEPKPTAHHIPVQ